MFKQIIIVRKDLNMSPGKLAAQVSHASMAFLTTMLRESAIAMTNYAMSEWGTPIEKIKNPKSICCYDCEVVIDKDTFEQWVDGEFTKAILRAKNKNYLLKAVGMAKELGMVENKDFFLIKDNCHTELEPEEDGQTLTCIGFRPMDAEIIDKIGKNISY